MLNIKKKENLSRRRNKSMNAQIKIQTIEPKLNNGKPIEGKNQWGGKWQLFTINGEYDIFSTLIEKNKPLMEIGKEIDIDYKEGKFGKTIEKVYKAGGVTPPPNNINSELLLSETKRTNILLEGINEKLAMLLDKSAL